jgi:hypothetical protein
MWSIAREDRAGRPPWIVPGVRMTPALAVNVTDRLWDMTDLVALVDKYDNA